MIYSITNNNQDTLQPLLAFSDATYYDEDDHANVIDLVSTTFSYSSQEFLAADLEIEAAFAEAGFWEAPIKPSDVPTTDTDLAQSIADEINQELAELMIDNADKDGEVQWTYDYLMTQTIRNLKAMAKGAGIKNYSRWSKYQLADALMSL